MRISFRKRIPTMAKKTNIPRKLQTSHKESFENSFKKRKEELFKLF